MTTLHPQYRLRIYAPRSTDPAEATVLTPAAGAPHSDKFLVATSAVVDGNGTYKAYLEQPRGRAAKMDPLTKRTDVGTMVFAVFDPKVAAGGPQSTRWTTAFFGSVLGRQRLVGCLVVSEESLDGGLTWSGFWTGRLQTVTARGKLGWTLAVNDLSEDGKTKLNFVGLPHVAVRGDFGIATSATTTTVSDSTKNWPVNAFAGRTVEVVWGTSGGDQRTVVSNTATQITVSAAFTATPDTTSVYRIHGYAALYSLLPFDIVEPYGTFVAYAPLYATVQYVGSFFNGVIATGLVFDTQYAYHHWTNVETKELKSAVVTVDPPGMPGTRLLPTGWNTDNGTRAMVQHLGGQYAGQIGFYQVVMYQVAPRPGAKTNFVKTMGIAPLTDATAPGYLPMPANGINAALLATFRDATLTDSTTPLLLQDVHPIQLVKDLAAGYFGFLYAPGMNRPAGRNVGDPMSTIKINASAFAALIADTSYPPFRGFITEAMGFSDFVEKYICQAYQVGLMYDELGQLTPVDLRNPSTTPAVTITDADVDPGAAFSWSVDRGSGINRVDVDYYLDYFPTIDVNSFELPSLSDIIKTTNYTLKIFDVGSPDLGDKYMTLDAQGFRFTTGEIQNGIDRGAWLAGQAEHLVRELSLPYGNGGVYLEVQLRRTANTNGMRPGDLRTVNVSWIVDPTTNLRGGNRAMRCVQVTADGLHLKAMFLDLGEGVANSPTIGAPSQESGNTANGATVTVTLNGQSETVELQVAVTDTSVGAHPGDTDPSWTFQKRITATGATSAHPLPTGQRIWFRVRTAPTSYFFGPPPKLPSPWVYSSSVDLSGLAAPSNIVVTPLSTIATVTFVPGELFQRTEVYLAQPSTGTYALVLTLPAGTASFQLLGLAYGMTIGISIRHVDGIGGFGPSASTTFATLAYGNDPALPALQDFQLTAYA